MIYGYGNNQRSYTTATHTTVSVTNSSTLVLDANIDRKYVFIQNVSTQNIWLSLDGTAASGKGILLGPNDAYEAYNNSNSNHCGTFHGYAASAANVNVIEGV